MKSLRTCAKCGVLLVILVGLGLEGSEARADALYGITNLGTLFGQSSSVATSINNNGQVVGISYNSSDRSFADSVYGSTAAPIHPNRRRYQSFLYSNGQMAQINPTGGLAMSINDLGQIVGGPFTSINNAGQYVGGGYGGVINAPGITTDQLITGGVSTQLSFTPYAMDDAGRVGLTVVNENGGTDFHPVVYQNGQTTDLFSKVDNRFLLREPRWR